MTGCVRRLQHQRGFTLLELMISMTLTAMLLGMLSAGVYSVVNDWKKDTTNLDATLDKTLVVLQLERAMEAAFPHSYIDPEKLARFVYFEGDATGVSFVSTVSPQRVPGLTAWRLTSDAEKGLQLKLTPAFSDNPDARFDALEPVNLLPGYTARIQYLAQRNPDEKEWLDEWSGSANQSLPLAVHITLTPKDSQDPDGPLEIIAPIRSPRHVDIDPVVTPQ